MTDARNQMVEKMQELLAECARLREKHAALAAEYHRLDSELTMLNRKSRQEPASQLDDK